MFRRIASFIHRRIRPIHYARSLGVRLGENCRLIDVDLGSEPWLITMGNHVSATNVSFVTHDGGAWVFRGEIPDIDVIAPIKIGDNVFIGIGSIILPGVTIGNNVVIGAGSVVSRDIPPDCVAAGIPAKPLRPLDEYRAQILAKAEPTKNLSPHEKRDFYLRKYDQS